MSTGAWAKNLSNVDLKHVRKKDITNDRTAIKNLFLRVVERSLQDCTGTSLGNGFTQASPHQKSRLANDSIRFLTSEWGLDICEFINIDRNSIVRAAEQYIEQQKSGTVKKKYRSL